MALCGVADDLADLLLRGEPAVGFAVVNALFVLIAASDESVSARRDPIWVSSGYFFDLDPPALIVGQMPVEFVDLVQREDVDVGLHVLDREEMAADVEYRPAAGERGLVADDAGGNLSSGDQLLKASKPVQHRLGRRCRDRYALSADFQKVLFGFVARLQLQRHGMFSGAAAAVTAGFRSGGALPDGAGENLRGRAQLFVRDDDGRSGTSAGTIPASSSTSAGGVRCGRVRRRLRIFGRQVWTAKIRNRMCFTVWILVER